MSCVDFLSFELKDLSFKIQLRLMLKSLEELRKESRQELAEDFQIPYYKAKHLKSALKPKYYPIITDHSRSTEDMLRDTKLSRNSLNFLRTALTSTGVDSKRIPSPSSDEVLLFLRYNPSTYEEICAGTGKTYNQAHCIAQTLRKKDRVRSVEINFSKNGVFCPERCTGAPHNRSIFFLPGDEEFLGLKVTEFVRDDLTPYMERSLSNTLRRILPSKAFYVAHRLCS